MHRYKFIDGGNFERTLVLVQLHLLSFTKLTDGQMARTYRHAINGVKNRFLFAGQNRFEWL